MVPRKGREKEAGGLQREGSGEATDVERTPQGAVSPHVITCNT